MPPKRKKSSNSASTSASFQPGSAVEICSDDVGFRGSWFTGTIIRRSSKDRFLVEYQTLFADEKGSKPLRELTPLHQLRPAPPIETHRVLEFGEEVDAFHNDGWWEGVITQDFQNGRFAVYFRSSKEQIEFSKEELRLHREWVDGNWVPPFEQQNVLTPDVKSNETVIGETFSVGKLVEVSSDEDGFQGAWFSATIVEVIGKDKFLVEYQSLLADDDSGLLREEIDFLHIRPHPPDTCAIDQFKKLQEVDALYNDGWWVGVVSKVLRNNSYVVYFRNTNEEIEFQHSQLRPHQEWIGGKWVMASKALKL